MESIVKADLYRYVPQPYNLRSLLQGFRCPGFFYTYLIRKASMHKKYSFYGIFHRTLYRYYSYKFGFQIPVITKIGRGFYIGHFGNIVISSKAVLGKNCNIAHGVTIGAIGRGRRSGAPVIGDHVWLGTNSIVVGGISVGSNVLIAPGAFVNFDVPDNSVVIGNPGKIIPKSNATENYIIDTLD